MNITKGEIRAKADEVYKSSDGQISYNLGLHDGFMEGAEWALRQLLNKRDVIGCKEVLLMQVRKVTADLETMNLSDTNRRMQLDRKKAIQSVIQMIDELPAL